MIARIPHLASVSTLLAILILADPAASLAQPGACCIGAGCMLVNDPAECEGMFQGAGTTCQDPHIACPQPIEGACCDIAGGCTVVEGEENCNGIYQGDNTDCSTPGIDCPGPGMGGACCPQEGFCFEVEDPADCTLAEGLLFLGVGTTCEDPGVPCPVAVTGACCLPDGTCIEVAGAGNCFGTYLGDNTICGPGVCGLPPDAGACCRLNDVCYVTTQVDCEGNGFEFVGVGTSCQPVNPCITMSPLGACCEEGVCTPALTQFECQSTGGIWIGPGTTCTNQPCEAGACCLSSGGCLEGIQVECNVAGGLFTPGEVCSPDPCGVGACCGGANCTEETFFDCEFVGKDHQGVGTTCLPNPCAICATCAGDTSGDNNLSGLDVGSFTQCFIDAAGGPPTATCTCADMDGSDDMTAADIDLFVAELLGSDGAPCS